MWFVIAFVLVIASTSALRNNEEASRALHNRNLFEGDILGIDPNDRNVIPYISKRWTRNRIPYVIDSSLEKFTSLIESAMEEYHIHTCLKFVPRTYQSNYIKIFKGDGCYSFVGMINRGEQEVSLGAGCWYKGTIVHELGHAIGFFHEQNRSDRDDYLTIYWDNIEAAMQNPDLFEGDILGIDPTDRNAIPHRAKRWPNKKVPYVINGSLRPHEEVIYQAMDDFNLNTCLKFVKRTNEPNYIELFYGKGCYSHVGMDGRGKQTISIGNGCLNRGSIVHQLGHAIGFYHEHSRSDRNKYVVVYLQNVKEGMEAHFEMLAPHENLLLTPFDLNSIMLYGNFAFSKDGKLKTMIAMNGKKLPEVSSKKGLSESDIKRIRMMYNC